MRHRFTSLWRRRLTLAIAACALLIPWGAGAAQAREPESRGVFASPSRGEVLAPGALLEIRWNADCGRDGELSEEGGGGADEAELILSLDGGSTFPIRVSTQLSPCTSRFAWRVPALPSAHARLGLRTGEGEREGSERIELVSEEFAILPDAEGRPEMLHARGGEWWTPRQAPSLPSAEAGLQRNLQGAQALGTPFARWTDATAPVTPAAERLASRSLRFERNRLPGAAFHARALVSSPAAPVPLRC